MMAVQVKATGMQCGVLGVMGWGRFFLDSCGRLVIVIMNLIFCDFS